MYSNYKKPLMAALLFVLLALPKFGFSELNGEGDWQYWSAVSVEGQLTPKARVEIEEEFRFGDDIGDYYRAHTQILFGYKVLDWLEIAPGFREIFEEKSDVFKPEHRPQIDITGKWSLAGGWELSDRNRVEYRDKSGKPNSVRYRNQIKLKFPISWTQWKIRPYAAEEIFIESEGEGFNRNRVTAGLEAKILEHLKADLYFLWQATDSNDDWINNYILGSKLKFTF
jgi:hypothetical protein